MASILLWSTNTALKQRIQREFRGDRHYVWCSFSFDGTALARYTSGAAQPPTSDPCSIYRELRDAVQRSDSHNAKIADQKRTIKALATTWLANSEITADDRDEIVAMVDASDFRDWRPLIYAIPYAAVAARAKGVPRMKRASHEPEYLIEDLHPDEFHIIEPQLT